MRDIKSNNLRITSISFTPNFSLDGVNKQLGKAVTASIIRLIHCIQNGAYLYTKYTFYKCILYSFSPVEPQYLQPP